jgi:hypothetical protein
MRAESRDRPQPDPTSGVTFRSDLALAVWTVEADGSTREVGRSDFLTASSNFRVAQRDGPEFRKASRRAGLRRR